MNLQKINNGCNSPKYLCRWEQFMHSQISLFPCKSLASYLQQQLASTRRVLLVDSFWGRNSFNHGFATSWDSLRLAVASQWVVSRNQTLRNRLAGETTQWCQSLTWGGVYKMDCGMRMTSSAATWTGLVLKKRITRSDPPWGNVRPRSSADHPQKHIHTLHNPLWVHWASWSCGDLLVCTQPLAETLSAAKASLLQNFSGDQQSWLLFCSESWKILSWC